MIGALGNLEVGESLTSSVPGVVRFGTDKMTTPPRQYDCQSLSKSCHSDRILTTFWRICRPQFFVCAGENEPIFITVSCLYICSNCTKLLKWIVLWVWQPKANEQTCHRRYAMDAAWRASSFLYLRHRREERHLPHIPVTSVFNDWTPVTGGMGVPS